MSDTSIEIGYHKFGVVDVDGTPTILGCVLNGQILPEPSTVPEGYALRVDAGATLEQVSVNAPSEGVSE